VSAAIFAIVLLAQAWKALRPSRQPDPYR
jgi:hypothetical protein